MSRIISLAEDPGGEGARGRAVRRGPGHLEVMGLSRKSAGGGLDDQQFFFVSKAAARGNPDYLRAYLAEARRLG